MANETQNAVRHGTANLFADLGYADAETHLLKASLVSRIHDIILERKLRQTQAAKIMGIGQPDVSRMLRGQFRDFSAERLMRFLTAFGCEVDIVIRPHGQAGKVGTIQVCPPAPPAE